MPTNKELEKQVKKLETFVAEKTAEIEEAKRQAVHIPTSNVTVEEGSHSIDHGTIMDSEFSPDTNAHPSEDLQQMERNDLSFWGNSWAWTKANRAYGNKPEDSWFVNPTPKLIGEVMQNASPVFESCRVALQAGEHKEQMQREKERHLEFLRGAHDAELVSECLDMLTAYQSRFFESLQRYLGLCASYDIVANNAEADADALAESGMKKKTQGNVVRGWAARLIALTEAYHEVVTDERAYNLQFNFNPQTGTQSYNLFKWSVTNTLNKIGRRLARSIKSGQLDADRYRIPQPWKEEAQKGVQVSSDGMLNDFN